MRPSRGRDYWHKLVRAYERSGQAQRPLCKQHGVSLGTFQHWLYPLRREDQAAVDSTALLQVELPQAATASQPLEAGLPGGVVLRFWTGTDPRYIAALVAEVERPRC